MGGSAGQACDAPDGRAAAPLGPPTGAVGRLAVRTGARRGRRPRGATSSSDDGGAGRYAVARQRQDGDGAAPGPRVGRGARRARPAACHPKDRPHAAAEGCAPLATRASRIPAARAPSARVLCRSRGNRRVRGSGSEGRTHSAPAPQGRSPPVSDRWRPSGPSSTARGSRPPPRRPSLASRGPTPWRRGGSRTSISWVQPRQVRAALASGDLGARPHRRLQPHPGFPGTSSPAVAVRRSLGRMRRLMPRLGHGVLEPDSAAERPTRERPARRIARRRPCRRRPRPDRERQARWRRRAGPA